LATGFATGFGSAGAAFTVGFGGFVSGICTTSWQCGHFPFFPAAARGVRTTCPQKVQKNSIGPVSGSAAAGVAGAGFVAGF
jgi:hypothetical protein